MGRIEIESRPLCDGGVTIKYDGQVAAEGENVVSAFIILGGLLAENPCQVTMTMEEIGPWGCLARTNYRRGLEVIDALVPAQHLEQLLHSEQGVVVRLHHAARRLQLGRDELVGAEHFRRERFKVVGRLHQ